jgi:flagellar biosynthetic protein FlhB
MGRTVSDEGGSPGDKPYDATPRKLEQAREKGEIVRSADLNTSVVYGGFLLFGFLLAPSAFEAMGRLTLISLDRAQPLSDLMLGHDGSKVAFAVTRPSLEITLAILGAPALLLCVVLIAQRGFVFSPDKLAPKLSRISPVSNAKQKYGAEGLFQFAKSAAKLIIVSVLLAIYLWTRAELVLSSIHATPGQILDLTGRLLLEFVAVFFALSLLIGAIDWAWEWRQLLHRNRMSHQELKDETKQSEGDPALKQERRQRGHLIATNRMMTDVPTADVVIVNPTHFAVALRWDRKKGQVPICVAKGTDETAGRIRTIAAEHGVPVFSDPPTARALHATLDIGAPIRSDQFRAVAAAIRFADAIRVRARTRRAAARPGAAQ